MSGTKLKLLLLVLVFIILGGGLYARNVLYDAPDQTLEVTSFEECINAGNPVLESYPRQCRTPDGQLFVEEINQDDRGNLIRLFSPQPNKEIASPLTVTGEARGTWYFEATFPIVVTDWDGRIIGEGYAEAQKEWMTEDFVPFVGTITFEDPTYKNYGALILQKANPSDLPENDNALEIPILFRDVQWEEKPAEETGRERGGCMVTGCSGQVCAEGDVVTTCEYRPEYACYENAVCQRQADGQCGWTLTAAVGRCLQELSQENESDQLQE